MKPVTFDTLNSNASIFSEDSIAKNDASWRALKEILLYDHDLYWEIRKDNQINVYYEGGSLIRLHFCSKHKRLQAFIHEKYLGKDGSSYIDLLKYIEDNKLPIAETVQNIKSQIKERYTEKHGIEDEECWSEKYIQSQIILGKDPMPTWGQILWLDSEFAYKNDDFDIRIDLVSCVKGELRFVELKRLDDPRMLTITESAPEVVRQMNEYRRFAKTYEKEIIAYYQKVMTIKKRLGLPTPRNGMPTRLNTEPLLFIYNRWTKRTEKRVVHTRRMERILCREKINYAIWGRNRLDVDFAKDEHKRHINLYYKQHFFGSAANNGYWTYDEPNGQKTRKNHKFILSPEDSKHNLFPDICDDALAYFKDNDISWWRQEEDGYFPSGHMVSSQIHCLNHLFVIRKDKEAVKAVISKATNIQFDEVLPSTIDRDGSYISFEFVLDNDRLLGENDNGWKRGTLCTSIDALVRAKKDGKTWLIPIEWKYTETYRIADKTNATRLGRYGHLIEQSHRLKTPEERVAHSVYFFEPNYELMRQTLLCEQLVADGYADDFFHINVIPVKNEDLRTYVKNEFVPMLQHPQKFCIIDPQDLLAPLKGNKHYEKLLNYLSKRYWNEEDS